MGDGVDFKRWRGRANVGQGQVLGVLGQSVGQHQMAMVGVTAVAVAVGQVWFGCVWSWGAWRTGSVKVQIRHSGKAFYCGKHKVEGY